MESGYDEPVELRNHRTEFHSAVFRNRRDRPRSGVTRMGDAASAQDSEDQINLRCSHDFRETE